MNAPADMLACARQAMARAYAPYSRFPVGACLRGESGRLHAGSNVENAAYPQSQCAEASAIGAMVTAGDRRIVEIVIVGGGQAPCLPCGGCRQRLTEFAGPDTPVHVCSREGVGQTLTLGDLLPHAFDARTLQGSGGSPGPTPAPSGAPPQTNPRRARRSRRTR
jgi:cytidine deaminase